MILGMDPLKLPVFIQQKKIKLLFPAKFKFNLQHCGTGNTNCILKLECSTWKSWKIDFNRLWRQSLPFSNDSLNRSFLCLFLKSYTVCFVALSTSLPAKSGSSTKGCSKACPFNYDPICAQPQGGSGPKLAFGNDCVLENYNCEHANARKSPLYAEKC